MLFLKRGGALQRLVGFSRQKCDSLPPKLDEGLQGTNGLSQFFRTPFSSTSLYGQAWVFRSRGDLAAW
jgi:hypothetical protein